MKTFDKNKLHSKIDFGMPTLIELNSLKENVELCKKLNLDFIELNMNIPFCTVLGYDEKNDFEKSELENFINELNFYQNEFGIYFTIHLDENFNFADMNPYVRNAYLQTLLNKFSMTRHILLLSAYIALASPAVSITTCSSFSSNFS